MGNSNYNNKLYLIVGAKGRGKTTRAEKTLVNSMNKGLLPLVFDPRRDYLKHYNKPLLGRDEFVNKILLPAKKSAILLEESTIFFPNTKKDPVLYDKIIALRYDENDIILVYHSLRSVPSYIIEQADYLTLFKTSDTESFIRAKFKGDENLINLYDYVQENAGDDEKKLGEKSGQYNFKETIKIN